MGPAGAELESAMACELEVATVPVTLDLLEVAAAPAVCEPETAAVPAVHELEAAATSAVIDVEAAAASAELDPEAASTAAVVELETKVEPAE